jgi:hypothetical protein
MMSLEGFIIDTNVCMVELKSEVPMAFYEEMKEVCFNTLMGQVDAIFIDKFGREMSVNEKQFVQLLFWQSVGKPFITFFSILEQWMYWLAIDWQRVVMLSEGENDES